MEGLLLRTPAVVGVTEAMTILEEDDHLNAGKSFSGGVRTILQADSARLRV